MSQVLKQIRACMGLTDVVLRDIFPHDYDARCMYAAFGISSLLRQLGLEANIAGGDFLALVVSQDGRQASLQGFGGGSDPAMPSHFWVESSGLIIDLGPHYLPRGSSFPAANMPAIVLPAAPSHSFLRYRPKMRYAPDVQLVVDEAVAGRMRNFLGECHGRWKAGVRPALPTWIFDGEEAMQLAMSRSDLWAHGAIRFASRVRLGDLPF